MTRERLHKEKINIIWLVLLFVFVYDCYFYGLTLTTNLYLAILGIPALIIYLFTKKRIVLKQSDILIVITFMALIVWAFLVLAINNSNDFSYIKDEILRNIVFPFFSAFFVASIGKKAIKSIDELFHSVAIISTVQSVIIISSFIVPSIKEFIMSIQFIGVREVNILNVGIRSLGLGTRFDFGAFTMSVVLLMLGYLYLNERSRCNKNIYIILFILNSLAGILLARSVFVGILLAVIYIAVNDDASTAKFSFIVKSGLLVLGFIVIIFVFFPEIIANNSKTIDWILQYFPGNSSNSYSADTLKVLFGEMYFWPEDIKTFLIGDGIYTGKEGIAYLGTDPLYMRYLLYGGIPCLVLFIIFLILLIKKIKIQLRTVPLSSEKLYKMRLFWMFFLILCLLVYVKIDHHFYKIIYLVIWLLVLWDPGQNKNATNS